MSPLMTEPAASTLIVIDETDKATLSEIARVTRRPLSTVQRAVNGLLDAGILHRPSPRAVATRKLASPMARKEARDIVSVYSSWQVVAIDPALIVAGRTWRRPHNSRFWDALIIEAARVAGANRLLTEDLQDGRVIEGVRIENPFLR